MNTIRIFHPVGMGGMASECVLDQDNVSCTMLYDCGGRSASRMRSYLVHLAPQEEVVIDALFLSHFHYQHINGLSILLRNKRIHVRHLVIPALTPEMATEVLIHNSLLPTTRSDDGHALVLDIYNSVHFGDSTLGDTRIVQVMPYEGTLPFNPSGDLFPVAGEHELPPKISSGSQIGSLGPWRWVPYNSPRAYRVLERFSAELAERLAFPNLDPRLIPALGSQDATLCRQVYNSYFDCGHMGYSMLLLSGIPDPLNPAILGGDRPNCLYTGDYEPQIHANELVTFFGDPLLATIGTMQVPSHGDQSTFSPTLYRHARQAIIHVGEGNSSHLPHIDTLVGIQRQGCTPTIVTEAMNTIHITSHNF